MTKSRPSSQGTKRHFCSHYLIESLTLNKSKKWIEGTVEKKKKKIAMCIFKNAYKEENG